MTSQLLTVDGVMWDNVCCLFLPSHNKREAGTPHSSEVSSLGMIHQKLLQEKGLLLGKEELSL